MVKSISVPMSFDKLRRPLKGSGVIWSTNDLRKESLNTDEEMLMDDQAFINAQVVCLMAFSVEEEEEIEDKNGDFMGSTSPDISERTSHLSYSIRQLCEFKKSLYTDEIQLPASGCTHSKLQLLYINKEKNLGLEFSRNYLALQILT